MPRAKKKDEGRKEKKQTFQKEKNKPFRHNNEQGVIACGVQTMLHIGASRRLLGE